MKRLKKKEKPNKSHNKTNSGAQTEHFIEHSDPVIIKTNENPLQKFIILYSHNPLKSACNNA